MEPEIFTFLLAMLPFSELRGSLPLALTFFELNPLKAFLFSVLGNIIIVPLIFIFLSFFRSNIFNKFAFSKKISEKVFFFLQEKYRSKSLKSLIGLTLFVAVPFPFTGAWSGSIIAFLLGIPFKLAIFSIALGIFLSGLLVFFLTASGIFLAENFGWQILALFFLIISLFLIFFNKKNK